LLVNAIFRKIFDIQCLANMPEKPFALRGFHYIQFIVINGRFTLKIINYNINIYNIP
jgi:hypothetical protein